MFGEDDLEEIKPIFLEESYEGLDVMESGLLNLDVGSVDLDTINDIFRAAHSIKGGAATFGFNAVSEFTHGVETLLDQMRAGDRVVTADSLEVLLSSVDCLREMLDAIRDNADVEGDRQQAVTARIEAILGGEEATPEVPVAADAPEETSTGAAKFRIVYHPHGEVFRTGNDPIHIVRELASLGELDVSVDTSGVPAYADIDPTECYLAWEMTLEGNVQRESIEAAFEWVEDVADIEIACLSEPAAPAAEAETAAETAAETETETAPDTQTVAAPEAKSGDTTADAGETAETEAADKPQLRVVPDAPERRQGDRRKDDRRGGAQESSSIRVDIQKIDALLNLVGELVITQSALNRFRRDFSETDLDELRDGLVQLERNTRELQESAMQVRMLPIKVTFSRFPRMVHDLSVQLGKKIQLNVSGEGTELDKTVLEKIGDPLVHLIRNSVDHGIESAEDRLAAGKPETGTVNLSAYHEAGNIVIEVADDGAGLNRERVLAKARQRGLVSEDAQLTDEYIHNLIFQPGFSTAEKITGVSGRGVGMDVVRRNIQDLGGRIEVKSEEGAGTTFVIRLPLTLAILDGQLVQIGNFTYVIPLLSITESIQIDAKKLNLITGKTLVYQFRDENIPVVRASEVWNFADEHQEDSLESLGNKLLVVVKSGDQLIGLVVDDLLEQQQVVIKSLETNYQQIEGISGATILGDGSVVLIFDIPGLVHLCLDRDARAGGRPVNIINN